MTITDGAPSSASQMMELLTTLQKTGAQTLKSLADAKQNTMFRFQREFNALTGKQQRAARLLSPDIACRFVASDFLDIDQVRTSATVRADSQAVTLRESSSLVAANIRSLSFVSATGTVNQFNSMYQVTVPDSSVPTGVFEIQLYDAQEVTLLVFDAVLPPSTSTIHIFGSQTGVSWTEALGVSQSGSRINAWFPNQPFLFLRVEIQPSQPDAIGGKTYTFGASNLNIYTVDYQLYSQFVSKPVAISPVTSQVRFRAADLGVNYYLTLGSQLPRKVNPGDILTLPEVNSVEVDTHINTNWVLCAIGSTSPYAVPAALYPSSLRVLDVEANAYMRVAYGLDVTKLQPGLTNPYVGVQEMMDLSWQLVRVPVTTADNGYGDESGRTFRLQYVSGPAAIPAVLLVQLTTANRATTPVFTGAYLENVYA